MAQKGTGYFDAKGQFFRSADAATESDLASLLGQIGDGESLAPGIAHTLMEKRVEIERLFAEHDAMIGEEEGGTLVTMSDKVTKLRERGAG